MTESILNHIHTVAVTGASGTLGRKLVNKLEPLELNVRCLSRRAAGDGGYAVDLNTGSGLEAALRGADVVVHLASAARDGKFSGDVVQTRNLVEAAKAAGVRHLIYVSIVGIDRIPFTYYKAKLECERIIMASGLPYTIVRATQFHEFIDELLHRAQRWGVVWIPKTFKFQSVDAEAVAEYLTIAVQRRPAMSIENVGGPDVGSFIEMARTWMSIRNVSYPVVGLPLFGKVATGFRRAYNTTKVTLPYAITWEEWLIRKYGIDRKKFETTELEIKL